MEGLKDRERLGSKRYTLSKRWESHVTQRHISEERNHRLHCCEHLKTRNNGNVSKLCPLLSNLWL